MPSTWASTRTPQRLVSSPGRAVGQIGRIPRDACSHTHTHRNIFIPWYCGFVLPRRCVGLVPQKTLLLLLPRWPTKTAPTVPQYRVRCRRDYCSTRALARICGRDRRQSSSRSHGWMHRPRGRQRRSALRLWRLGVAVMLTFFFLGCRLPKGRSSSRTRALAVGRFLSLVPNRTHGRLMLRPSRVSS